MIIYRRKKIRSISLLQSYDIIDNMLGHTIHYAVYKKITCINKNIYIYL